MFGLYLLTSALGISPYAALVPVFVGGFFIGLVLYWMAVHRVIGRPPLMSLLSTFSVNLVLIGLGTAVWGTVLFNVAVTLPGVSWQRYTFPGTHLLAAALTAVIAGMLVPVPLSHADRQGGTRGGGQSRGRGTGRHSRPRACCRWPSPSGVALAGVSGMLIAHACFPSPCCRATPISSRASS